MSQKPPAKTPRDSSTPSAIAEQLVAAQAELAAMEQLVEELPQILEQKFRQRLAEVVENNRQLQQQHQHLLSELHATTTPLPLDSQRWRPEINWRLPKLPAKKVTVIAVCCVSLSLVGWGLQSVVSKNHVQHVSSPNTKLQTPLRSSDNILIVNARGTSWVEVQDLASREVVLIGELQAGEQRKIRLHQGLRLRSGRPDLISIQIDDGTPAPLADIDNLDWRIVLPPTLKKAPA